LIKKRLYYKLYVLAREKSEMNLHKQNDLSKMF